MGVGTGSAALAARDTGYPVIHQISCSLVYTETSAKVVGIIPAGSIIVRASVLVSTAFNDSGTDLVTFGSTTSANEFVSSGFSVATVGLQPGTLLAAAGVAQTNDTTVYVKYTGQNGNPSAGAGYAVVEFIPRPAA